MGEKLHQCPACREPLVALEWQGVEIDFCPACGGTWLDAGELEQIAHLAGVETGELTRALHAARHPVASTRRCPRCARNLREVTVGERPPVALDRCPRGHGLWFDAGEVQAVVEQFESGESGAVAKFFAELFPAKPVAKA